MMTRRVSENLLILTLQTPFILHFFFLLPKISSIRSWSRRALDDRDVISGQLVKRTFLQPTPTILVIIIAGVTRESTSKTAFFGFTHLEWFSLLLMMSSIFCRNQKLSLREDCGRKKERQEEREVRRKSFMCLNVIFWWASKCWVYQKLESILLSFISFQDLQ